MNLHPPRPPEQPLAMPAQRLGADGVVRVAPVASTVNRRLIGVLALATLLASAFIVAMHGVLDTMGMTTLEWALLVVFAINIAWIAFAFVSASAGFAVMLRDRRRRRLGSRNSFRPSARVGIEPSCTAIVFPVYNEHVGNVFATVESVARGLDRLSPGPDRFECFILSDSTDPEIALSEEAAFLNLQRRRRQVPVFYRRRTINKARKAGNIHDFVSRWGGRYDHMIVFDADSYMSVETLYELVARMKAEPQLGLIQTVPTLIGAKTLFARVQQFAAALYGPLLGSGVAWWSRSNGNYWGHNAIIRVRAFAAAAGLPVLPGRLPLGGHILSHDFVEAALLCRAGWQVRVDADLAGSYEECPPTLIDLSVRDRRWCQGNLQHAGVLARMRGLTFTSRLHLGIGIQSYLASPMWLALILIGLCLSLQNRFLRPEYFVDGVNLFPSWPVIDPGKALAVFGATMAILFLPKLYGLLAGLLSQRWRNTVGARRLLGGVGLEVLLSALLAPVMMAAQTAAVVSVLLGRDAGWAPQKRDADGYAGIDIVRRHLPATLSGVLLLAAALAIAPTFALWLLPAVVGLVLSIPISMLSGSLAIGHGLLQRGWLGTPEEVEVPECFRSARRLRKHYRHLSAPGFDEVLWNHQLQQWRAHLVDSHWPLAPREVYPPLAIAVARARWQITGEGLAEAFSAPERLALLNSPRDLALVSGAVVREQVTSEVLLTESSG